MITLTESEKRAILTLFKDLNKNHNATSIAQRLEISQWGGQKLLKRLTDENILVSEKMGNTIIYKPNIEEDYVLSLLQFLLTDEAQAQKRWLREFTELKSKTRIAILHGSIVKNSKNASDIDILTVARKENINEILTIYDQKRPNMLKPIHNIELIPKDFQENLEKKDKVILDIVKNGIVLFGQNEFVKVIKDFTRIP